MLVTGCALVFDHHKEPVEDRAFEAAKAWGE